MENENQPEPTMEQVSEIRDHELLTAMRGIGLLVQEKIFREKRIFATGFKQLFVMPESVGVFVTDDGVFSGGSLGVTVAVQDPAGNEARMVQVISNFNAADDIGNVEELLADLAHKWVAGTLPSLCHLFGADKGEIAGRLKLQSYTEGDEQITLWEGFIGQPQFWGNPR